MNERKKRVCIIFYYQKESFEYFLSISAEVWLWGKESKFFFWVAAKLETWPKKRKKKKKIPGVSAESRFWDFLLSGVMMWIYIYIYL